MIDIQFKQTYNKSDEYILYIQNAINQLTILWVIHEEDYIQNAVYQLTNLCERN